MDNPLTSTDKLKISNFILIILFAIVFAVCVQDGLRLVVQKTFQISRDDIYLARWGDSFFWRIVASLVATASGAFVIGTFLKKKAKLAAIIAALPSTIFWISSLVIGIIYFNESVLGIKFLLVQPAILAILTPISAYYGVSWGQECAKEFQRPKSVLNIKWYHWLWILPIYLNKVVAVPLATLIFLWTIDAQMGEPSMLDFIFKWDWMIVRIIVFMIFCGLLTSVNHAYTLLSEENETKRIKWKNAAMTFGHVFLFMILYVLLFAGQQMPQVQEEASVSDISQNPNSKDTHHNPS